MADTKRTCPSCGADCQAGVGLLDQTGAPKKTITWTCLNRCGYKRWDPLVPGDGVTVEEAPPGTDVSGYHVALPGDPEEPK